MTESRGPLVGWLVQISIECNPNAEITGLLAMDNWEDTSYTYVVTQRKTIVKQVR